MASKKRKAQQHVVGGSKAALAAMASAFAPRPAAPKPTQSAPAPQAPAPILPFLTGDDLLTSATTLGQYAQQGLDLDRQKADSETDTQYQLKQNEMQAAINRAAALENAGSRGIFQSSIKDANIYDIEAQRAMSQKLLNDKLATAQIDYETKRGALNNTINNFNKAMTSKAVENASNLSANQSVATPPAPSAPAAPKPAARPSTPQAPMKISQRYQVPFAKPTSALTPVTSGAQIAARARMTGGKKNKTFRIGGGYGNFT